MSDEKRSIEIGTAEGFLHHYNKRFGASFRTCAQSDAPDIQCVDDADRQLNLEITMTQDSIRDIQALLGRSDHRSVSALISQNKDTGRNQNTPSCVLFDDVFAAVVDRIKSKFDKDYGRNVALVVRDTSGCDWEWDDVVDRIASALELDRNPFDEGIWLLTRAKDKLFLIIAPRR